AQVADDLVAGRGDPGGAPLTRHGDRQVLTEPVVAPWWLVAELGGQHGVHGAQPRLDLPVRRGRRIPLSNPHLPSLPNHHTGREGLTALFFAGSPKRTSETPLRAVRTR